MHFIYRALQLQVLQPQTPHISQEKTPPVSIEETYQVQLTDLLLITVVSSISCPLQPFQLPVFSILNFIYMMMSSTMSWKEESLGVTAATS